VALPAYRFRLVVGGAMLALGVFWTIVSVLFFFTRDVRAAAPVNLALAVVVLAVPGAVLWGTGRRRRARHERRDAVVAVARERAVSTSPPTPSCRRPTGQTRSRRRRRSRAAGAGRRPASL